ncbi:putative insulin-like peptide receptor [Aricia agestis]|uniref:putative insulin-like peptide receptor n=1 Tax=Aricia agestis TaxID=91739 RepID=UPI001C203DAF|nr:putative insulin-like peptide receptor [Aricia agestis]
MANWYRVAVISEATESAYSFIEELKASNDIIWKDVTTSSDKNRINETLKQLKNMDARIFVLNSEWSLSKQILCAAIELDLTTGEYVWVTRTRDVLECDGKLVDDLKHISISLEWRGGSTPINVTRLSREEWKPFDKRNYKNRTSDSNWDNFILPSNLFYVVEAITRISQAFVNFRNEHYELIYDLHGKISAMYIASNFDNTTSVNGSRIFIDEWWGNKIHSIAVWEAHHKNISIKWHHNENIFEGFQQISDRKKCLIKSGDAFSPRCHDVAVILSIIIMVLLTISLVIVRRLRLASIAQKDLFLLNAVINHRKHVASSLEAYLVERHLVRVLHEIGSGYFGRVHFAELTRPGSDAVVVAAKEPHDEITLEEEHEFLHEASILALLTHNHIVRLIGICIKDGPPMVLMEHALYLDLRRYLIERRHLALKDSFSTSSRKSYDDISDESLTRFVKQAAAALEYLASRRIVHRDVRAANCLIDKERSLKLADFGMARRLNGSDCEYASNRRALFPVLYMAPESLDMGVFSPASDVWAMGVLILEVVRLGARPFGSWPATRVVRHVSMGGHAPLPPDVTLHTRNLVMSCWKRDPQDRPSAAEIEHYLTTNPQALSAALLSPDPLTEN